MPKYSVEFKLEVVKDYLSGKNDGGVLIAKKYGIPVRAVNNWINWNNARGKHGWSKKVTNKSYSSEFKLSVIKYKETNTRSLYTDSSYADLYNELTMPPELRKAHQENDKTVMETYGFDWRTMTEADIVAELIKVI